MGVTVSKSLCRRRSTVKVEEIYIKKRKEKSTTNGGSSSSSSGTVEFLTPGARIRSLKIDRQLAKDRDSLMNIYKILLLGAAESGKSTIFKQMR